jgi:hypothetical protein
LNGISVGGHVGGFLGGILGMLALTRLGRVHGFYGRPGALGSLLLVAVAVASVVLSIWAAKQGCKPIL